MVSVWMFIILWVQFIPVHLFQSIAHFFVLGQPITGPEIASLLSVLVDAANEGSLAEVHV